MFSSPKAPKLQPPAAVPPVNTTAPLAQSSPATQRATRDVRAQFARSGRQRNLLTPGKGAGVLSGVSPEPKRLLGA